MEVSGTIFSSLFLSLCLLVAGSTQAQTTGTGLRLNGGTPSGLSSYTPETTNGTTKNLPVIYGGYTGTAGTCGSTATPSSSSTCDSCVGSLSACNKTSVHPALYLNIPLVSNTTATFEQSPQVKYKLSTETITHAVDNPTPPVLAAGQGFNAQITWANLCRYSTGNANCVLDSNGSFDLTVGIVSGSGDTFVEKVDFKVVFRYVDGTGNSEIAAPCTPPATATGATDGVCSFAVTKGDEKIYISEILTSSKSLSTSNASVKYDRIILFYNKDVTDASTVTPLSQSAILALQNNDPQDATIQDPRIRALENGHSYCFLLGNMDQTGIISNFISPTALGAQRACATPDAVVGLLDDKSCFIATATFGSPMAPEVVTFRQFRNEFLLTNAPGKAFVKFYYQYGPIAANWVSQNEVVKTVSLAVLWPLLIFAKLSLAFGFIPAALVALISGVVSARLWSQLRRTRASTH